MSNFKLSFNEDKSTETKTSGTIEFKSGDEVTVMVTDFLPGYAESEEVLKKTPIGGNWMDYATFEDGLLMKAVAIDKKIDKKTKETFVKFDADTDTITMPLGKFGFQFYYKISQDQFFGQKFDRKIPLQVNKVLSTGKKVRVTLGKDRLSGDDFGLGIENFPRNWNKLKPEDRLSYWKYLTAAQLLIGQPPSYVCDDNKWDVNLHEYHQVQPGDCFTIKISRGESKKGFPIYYLQTWANSAPKGNKPKYTYKNDYDLFHPAGGTTKAPFFAKLIDDAINKKNGNGTGVNKKPDPWEEPDKF